MCVRGHRQGCHRAPLSPPPAPWRPQDILRPDLPWRQGLLNRVLTLLAPLLAPELARIVWQQDEWLGLRDES